MRDIQSTMKYVNMDKERLKVVVTSLCRSPEDLGVDCGF
jgi:hypothetical protein